MRRSSPITPLTGLIIALFSMLGVPASRADDIVDVAAPASAAAPEPALVRITSSFDAKHAHAVLRQVAKLMHAGFVRHDAEQVAHDIESLPADQSRRWEFLATYKRQSYPLQI